MLRQYLELKEQAGSALLLYRMGDFYELFFEDAQKAAPVLGITLTRRRQNDSVDAPMCGVPHHAFDGYLGKLLDAGFRVAVAEQVEDPAKAKGLVRREIVCTHTPGTISDTELLEGSEHEHLARLRPREVLVAEDWDGWQEVWPAEIPRPTVTPVPPDTFSPSAGEQRLRRVLGVASLRGFGLDSGACSVMWKTPRGAFSTTSVASSVGTAARPSSSTAQASATLRWNGRRTGLVGDR
jgi:DNA mismatch repair protein MutS